MPQGEWTSVEVTTGAPAPLACDIGTGPPSSTAAVMKVLVFICFGSEATDRLDNRGGWVSVRRGLVPRLPSLRLPWRPTPPTTRLVRVQVERPRVRRFRQRRLRRPPGVHNIVYLFC